MLTVNIYDGNVKKHFISILLQLTVVNTITIVLCLQFFVNKMIIIISRNVTTVCTIVNTKAYYIIV